MLTKLEVYNARNALLSLPLSGGTSYPVIDVDGLDPVKVEIMTNRFANFDGEQYQGARGGMRNIVLTLGFAPDYHGGETVADLRSALFSHFMPKSSVKLVLTSTHMPVVEITGYVESCGAKPMSKDPEVQVSILCTKSDFINPQAKVVTGVCGAADTVVTYDGTVNTGLVLGLTLSNAASTWSFVNNTGVDEIFGVNLDLNPLYSMAAGSSILVKTTPGAKLATCSTDTTYKMLSYVANASAWPMFKPGVNTCRFVGPPNSNWAVTYYECFGGI